MKRRKSDRTHYRGPVAILSNTTLNVLRLFGKFIISHTKSGGPLNVKTFLFDVSEIKRVTSINILNIHTFGTTKYCGKWFVQH